MWERVGKYLLLSLGGPPAHRSGGGLRDRISYTSIRFTGPSQPSWPLGGGPLYRNESAYF